jgi:hypothetical protein
MLKMVLIYLKTGTDMILHIYEDMNQACLNDVSSGFLQYGRIIFVNSVSYWFSEIRVQKYETGATN